tara:strand:- start:3057 stop:3953 length:897 start_codon:yes stop_codon:yes gene_type:complete
MKQIILIISILIVLYFIFTKSKINFNTKNTDSDKINIWIYYPKEFKNFRNNSRFPTKDNNYYSPYLNLCINSIINNFDKSICNINLVTDDNLYNYLPDFPININNESRYNKKQIYDLIGGMLLYKHGGVWLFPGTICLKKNYNDLYIDILSNDIVTFGSNNAYNCNSNNPNNYIIASKKNNIVIKHYINRLVSIMLGKIDYLYNHVDTEFNPLGESINLFNVKHKHYNCLHDGTMNIHQRKLNLDDYLGKTPIKFSNKLMFISFPYELLDVETDKEWLKYIDINSLINSGINIINYIN